MTWFGGLLSRQIKWLLSDLVWVVGRWVGVRRDSGWLAWYGSGWDDG